MEEIGFFVVGNIIVDVVMYCDREERVKGKFMCGVSV